MAESAFSNLVYGRPIVPSSVGGLKDLRLIDLNLISIIKEIMLPVEGYVTRFSETISPGAQDEDPETGLTVTPYKSTYYDWVYYNPDPSNPALTGLLTTPTLSTSGSLAYIDYKNGTVYYSGTQTANITATYDYYSVYVQDGFPDWGEDIKDWEDMRLPLISIDHSTRRNIPFQLGGGYSQDRSFLIDIIANSDPQRDDLTEAIENALRYDYDNTINYSYGFPTKFNGDKNLTFDRGPATRWKTIRFNDVSSKVIRSPFAEDKFRHRSLISLEITTWD